MNPHHSTHTVISSPLGMIQITHQQGKLTQLTVLPEETPIKPTEDKESQSLLAELSAYFNNPKHIFTIPYSLSGTPFQQRVWQALQKIPSGQTMSYGALAKQLNTSPRAIGQACRTNPIPIVIPCHRVVAKTGMGGFAGQREGRMLQVKEWLLNHEM